jgi:hypothetical protein
MTRHRLFSAAGLIAITTLVLFLSGCVSPAQSSSVATTGATQAAVPVTIVTEQDELAGQTSGTTSYLIKVYFSRFGPSDNNLMAVFPVNRFSPSLAVATFSIQSLIAGPTLSERAAGYFTELNSLLSGPSVCNGSHPVGGPDFTLTLNKRGQKTEQGSTTVQFCRTSNSAGIGMDARILAEITATLKQFSNIKNVVVLTKAGNCFGDESGMDQCLK